MHFLTIRDSLRVLFAPGEVVEMRIPKTQREGTVSGYFDDIPTLARELASRNGDVGVYVTMNPCNPALLARCKNRVQPWAKELTTDKDILRRHWLLIDCDPTRPAGISSSKEEHSAALALAQKVRDELRQKGWPRPVLANSGNGYHLLYRIDLPNNEGARDLLKQILAALAAEFDTEEVKIDRNVFNASRIVKVYGTKTRKGENLPERPHRVSKLIGTPYPIRPVPYELLEDLVAGRASARQTLPSGAAADGFNLEEFLAAHLKARPPLAADSGQKWVLAECPFNADHKDAAVFRDTTGKLGFHCFHESCKDKHWSDLRQLFQSQAKTSSAGEPWPEPKPIFGLPPVASIDPDIISQPFRAHCQDVAQRMQVPLDYAYAAQVVTLSAVIGRRMLVQPKALDTSYRIVANLWGVVLGLSGSMKSPVVDDITQPTRAVQDKWQLEYQEAVEQYQKDKEQYETDLAEWKKNGRVGERPTAPEEPHLKQLLVNDSTYEDVHRIMAHNPAGIFLNRDELSGWLSMLDRPERGGERAFYLTAWAGKYSYNVGRIGRKVPPVPHACASLLGTMTPDRLKSYLINRESKSGPAELNDGLLQRLQVLVWPDLTRTYQHVDSVPSVSNAQRIYTKILELDPDTPTLWRWDPKKAQELYRAWDTDMKNNKVRHPETRDELRSHLSKYDKLLCALALQDEVATRILERQRIGAVSAPDKPYRFIRVEALERAIKACAYLETHARRAYFCVQSPELAAAAVLADRIRQRKLKDRFSLWDVYHNNWELLGDRWRVERAVVVLIDAGWLREEAPETANREKSGRALGQRYRINPRILEA
jgi:hypothetical protein